MVGIGLRISGVYCSLARDPLTNSDGVTLLDSEGGRAVGRQVLVSLLVSSVFGDEVEVFSSDDDGVGHFGRVDDTSEDSASDRDVTGERALLVDVSAVDGLCGVSDDLELCFRTPGRARLQLLSAAIRCRPRLPPCVSPSCGRPPDCPPILPNHPANHAHTPPAQAPEQHSPAGVLKPRPMSLYHRLVLVWTFRPPVG